MESNGPARNRTRGRRSVVEVLAARRRNGSGDDGARVALVLEGGGMRGAISAEMAAAISAAGLTDLVDIVVGTSAGAVNATGVAGGVIEAVSATYSDVFASPEFVSPRRLLQGQPAVDAKKITREMERRTSFVERALRPGTPHLVIVATDVSTGEAVYLDRFADAEDLYRSIQASATLPLLGGRPVEHRGMRLLDGGIVEALPVEAALQAGATHALVIATRPANSLPSHGITEEGVTRYLGRLSPRLAARYRARGERYASTNQRIRSGSYRGMATTIMTPGTMDAIPSRMDRDPMVLRTVRQDAQRRARELMGSWELLGS